MLIRLSRPLPGPFPRDLNDSLAHRHLDLLLDGMCTDFQWRPLSGPAMSLEDLQNLS
jgi:hypothetical protein